jgi:uncharacterized cysteine cluster protein YcgN (CxxCxxCC family)
VKLTPEMVKGLPWLHDDCGYMKSLSIKRSRIP